MVDLLSMPSRSGSIHSLIVQMMDLSITFDIIHDRQARQLDISQERYVEALLERLDMTTCNPVRTPLPASFKPASATSEEHAAAKDLNFPGLAGSVLYLSTITWPDIAFAAGLLACYISKRSTEHYQAAKHLLRYFWPLSIL
jgi:hypothetical protein